MRGLPVWIACALCAFGLASTPERRANAQAAAQPPIVLPTIGGVRWTPEAIAKLDADIDALLANAPTVRGAHLGIDAIDTATGAVLYARGADDEVQPASTLKLVVGSAALEKLTPRFVFHTTYRTFPVGAVDVVDAVMGGDPFLTAADLAEAARAVAASSLDSAWLGRRKVMVIDASHDDARPYPAGWTWDDFGQAYAPRVSAADLEEGLVHLIVTPSTVANAAPTVRTNSVAEVRPAIADDALTCAAAREDAPIVRSLATTGIAGSDDTLDVTGGPGRCIDVIGSIPRGAPPEAVDAAVPDPVAYARATANAALQTVGLAVASSAAIGSPVAANPRTIWAHESPPLATFLGPRFWIPSDNLVGELLLKELGFASAGKPGTTGGGIAYEKLWLQSIGVDTATVTLADGCGMSQYDRITAHDLVAILQHDWQGPNRALVLASLPVGGARGTIEGIAGTTVAGRVFAKTGSMMHVRGLAGYVATVRHGAVTFAFEVDDWNGDYPALAALRAAVLARIADD